MRTNAKKEGLGDKGSDREKENQRGTATQRELVYQLRKKEGRMRWRT